VTNPENNPFIQMVIRIAIKIQLNVHWLIANLPENFMQIRLEVFCAKLLTDRQ